MEDRRLRKAKNRVVRNYRHRGMRITRCSRFCRTCWWNKITGKHRRNRQELRTMFEDAKRETDECDHQWEERLISGRLMPQCTKCGLLKWVRKQASSQTPHRQP